MKDLNLKLSNAGVFLVMLVMVTACTEPDDKKVVSGYEELEVKVPSQIQQFDQIDSTYYSYLGINSFATDEGGFILPIWDPSALVKTNAEASEILATTVQGRGPGEIFDVGVPTMGDEVIYVYDQRQAKIVVLDRRDLSLVEEILPEPYGKYSIRRAYPAFEEGKLLLELSNSLRNFDKPEDRILIKFDSENEKYGESITIKDKPYAPLGDLVNGRASSAMMVPFSDNQFIVPVPDRKTLLLYDTRTNLIAEINGGIDTLRTIAVDLPTEKVTSAEKDSLRVKELPADVWKYMEPYLPEIKAKADAMLYYNDKIWLKSNLKGEGDTWFVLNMDGEITDLVSLPKNTYLTHVSEHHLGVRLDDVNFALYENPVGD